MITDYVSEFVEISGEEEDFSILSSQILEDFKNDDKFLNFWIDYLEEDEAFDLDDLRKQHLGVLISYYYADTVLSTTALSQKRLLALKQHFKEHNNPLENELDSVWIDEEERLETIKILRYLEDSHTSIDDVYERFMTDENFAKKTFNKIVFLATRCDETIIDSHLYYARLLFKENVIAKFNPYFQAPNNMMMSSELLNTYVDWLYNNFLFSLNDNHDLALYGLYQETANAYFVPYFIAEYYIYANAMLLQGESLSEEEYQYLRYIEGNDLISILKRYKNDETFALTVLDKYIRHYNHTPEEKDDDIDLVNQMAKNMPQFVKPFLLIGKLDNAVQKQKTKDDK